MSIVPPLLQIPKRWPTLADDPRPLDANPEPTSRVAGCRGSREPVVDVVGIATVDAYAELGILPSRPLRLRSGVLDRLQRADGALPSGFGLVILDGWRTLGEQRSLIRHYAGSGPTDGWVADPRATSRPPHMTGGAADLTLSFDGVPLALGTDFDSFEPDAHLHAHESRPGAIRDLRRLLGSVLSAHDFVGYSLEWWHWSYGDDAWAAARGCRSRYDVVAPRTRSPGAP